jgi:hypothetical protein
MAPLGAILTDEQVADALTFARTSWGNFAPPVSSDPVRTARRDLAQGGRLLDTAALLQAFPLADDRLVATTEASPGPRGGIPPFLLAGIGGGAVLMLAVVAVLRRKAG